MNIVLPLALAMALPFITQAQRTATPACGVEAKSYLTQGQPVVLNVTLHNHSFDGVAVDLGYNREGAFKFRLKREDGEWIELPQKKVREGISLVEKVPLLPYERYSQQIILDEWYKFTELGKHRLSVTLPNSLCRNVELDFEIMPFDAELLSDFSEDLVNTVRQNKTNYAKAADAAKVLATIDSPLAVPFLIKAFEANRMMDSIVIPAIEKIGDKQAVRFLISLLEQHDWTAVQYELVRPALVRLEKRSAPEDVETIRIALARFPVQ